MRAAGGMPSPMRCWLKKANGQVVADQHVLEVGEPGSGVLVADTLEELAEKMGVPARALWIPSQNITPTWNRASIPTLVNGPWRQNSTRRPSMQALESAVHHTMGGV